MNKDYILKDKTITSLLDSLQNIVTFLAEFKNGKYKYKFDIYKNDKGLWNAEINVNDEQENIKTVKTVTETSTLL